jgi:hypothetical protein
LKVHPGCIILPEGLLGEPCQILIVHNIGLNYQTLRLIPFHLAGWRFVQTQRGHRIRVGNFLRCLPLYVYLLDFDLFFDQFGAANGLIFVELARLHHLPQVRFLYQRPFLVEVLRWRQYHLKKLVLYISSLLRVPEKLVYERDLVLNFTHLILLQLRSVTCNLRF